MKHLIAGTFLLFLASCAQVVPLTGGDRDVTPPKAQEEIPANGTVNFKENKIIIRFDEYIQLKDIFSQVIITPQLKEQPEINANGKAVTIQFNEKLRDNTTYRIFFGNAIADITEGNILAGYEYSFSTGTFIDTLQLRGTIKDTYSGKPIKDGWVMMYFDTNDSIVYRSKPDYLTRTNTEGEYKLKGLRAGEYKLVVLGDINKNFLYDNGELFGYYNKTVSIPGDSVVSMEVFKEKPYKVYISKTEHLLPEKVNIIFNTGITKLNNVSAVSTGGDTVKSYSYKINRSQDTLHFYFNNPAYDSIYIRTGYNTDKLDSTLVTFLSPEDLKKQFERKRLPFELNPVRNPGATLPYHIQEYKLVSSFITDSIDPGKIVVKENGKVVKADAVSVVQSNEDSIGIRYKWKDASEYEVYLMRDFAKDNFGRGNDSLVFKFKTNERSDYGTLKLILLNPLNTNYLIQLINSSNVVAYEKRLHVIASSDELKDKKASEVSFTDMIPETYTIRVIIDTNNDGYFTPGNYLNKTQSETIMFYPQPIKIISDWDIEQNWDLGQ